MKKGLVLLVTLIALSIGWLHFNQRGLYSRTLSYPPHRFTPEETQFKTETLKEEFYSGLGGTKNYFASLSKPENPIPNPLILVVGLEDIPENWWNTANKAIQQGFQKVYIVELRGQGRSERVPGNSIKAAHVDKFSDYSGDFLLFIEHLSESHRALKAPPFIIAHSTGTLVISMALSSIKAKYPAFYPASLSFWAPFFRLKTASLLQRPMVYSIISGVDKFYRMFGVMILAKSFKPIEFKNNHLTNDKSKYQWSERIRRNDKLMSSGVSLHWAIEAIKTTEKIRSEDYSMIDRPCLIFKAENEVIVDNSWEPHNPMMISKTIPRARHALHMETPDIYEPLFDETIEFFTRSLNFVNK